ncbi:MAG: 50S ribosomal protein L21 [Alphaproteobacteria bacterium]|nr:50S ribosomal protein L21 [Alphaproteobacteria bacterium]
MFAVVRTGGKQYRVAENDVIVVEKLAGDAGEVIVLGDVLAVGDDKAQTIGTPTVSGASVAAQVLEQTRGDKIIVFKKKRRQGYRRKRGHRQELTALRVTEILTGGKKPSPAKAKTPAKSTTKTGAKSDDKPAAAAKKPAAKKPAAKADTKADAKPAAKKTEAKPAAKPAAKKPAAKKADDAKPAAKKAPAKKAPAKKPAGGTTKK